MSAHQSSVFPLLIALLFSGPARASHAAETPPPPDLRTLFSVGSIVRDTNGDSFADAAHVRFVLPKEPSTAQVVAAANIAARVGLETTAMDIPVARGPAGPGIAVTVTRVAGKDALGLGVDQGLVRFSANPAPSLLIAGTTDAGMMAAAEYVAGRLPYAWDVKGPTLEKMAVDLREILDRSRVGAPEIRINEVVVTREAVTRVVASVKVPKAADFIKARGSLAAVAARLGRARKGAPTPPLSYQGVASVRVVLSSSKQTAAINIRGVSPPAKPEPIARRASGAKEGLDLSTLYSIDGGLGDSDNNLIPDRSEIMISPFGEGSDGVIDLAARIGLESTGITLPLVIPAEAIDASPAKRPANPASADSTPPASDLERPEALPMLILVGAQHPVVQGLVRDGRFSLPTLAPGEGLIEVVEKAFGGQPGREKPAIVVAGGDATGVSRALAQLAATFPHVAARGKDRTTVDDIEEDVRRFVQGRSPEGQAATALYKLDRLVASLKGRDLASARVKVFVEKAEPGLSGVIRSHIGDRLGGKVEVVVESLDVQTAETIKVNSREVDGEMDIPSEVEAFWRVFRERVLPAVRKSRNAPIRIEVRLSEPPELRAAIETQIRTELSAAGSRAASVSVSVLSAYKQGYSWLIDSVMPRLVGKAVGGITLRFAEIGPPPEWKNQAVFAPTRWLLEAYPFADIMARDLKIDLEKIVIEKMPIGSPAYEVLVTRTDGTSLLRETFEPRWVLRSMFDTLPDYEKTRVTTGWIEAIVGTSKVADERVATDYERFWDIFQSRILGQLHDHVMAVHHGKPKPEDAPFFGEMNVDLTLSEPDYPLGLDEEQVSSTEMLHEEIYFNTLHFFDVLGRYARGPSLSYIGRIIPNIRATSDGKAGRLRYKVTGFSESRPNVTVAFTDRNGSAGSKRLDIQKVATERPRAWSTRVHAATPGLASLDLRVKVDSEKDERDELVLKAAEDRVDRTLLSAEQVTAMVSNLQELREAGLYRNALAYHDIGTIRVAAHWEHAAAPATERIASLRPNGRPDPWPDIRTFLPANYRYAREPLVQWDEPIAPPEGAGILARMSTFPEVNVYRAGRSYLGRDVWAMDILPEVRSSHLSAAKQTTIKPTVIYSARQHANEVSSTSHVLKLAELLLTDPGYREKLKRVNVVVHPFTNPDGAQLAYDLQKDTPRQMLHAGYLGSLGVDVTAAQNDPDPMYPETLVRPKLWRSWLPDIFLNPHGYPSHEWVQAFSEYAAWVRTRAVEARDYWGARGWWMPGFSWLDDPRYPHHKTEQIKLLSMITTSIKASKEVWAMTQRAYERYARYSFAFDQKNFKLDFTDDVLTYKAIKGSRASGGAGGSEAAQGSGGRPGGWMQRYPNVTIFEGSTEAPDETAHGDWLKLVATAGLVWDKANLEYLVQGNHQVERKAEPIFGGGVSLSMNRPRPPKPAATPER